MYVIEIWIRYAIVLMFTYVGLFSVYLAVVGSCEGRMR